MTCRDVAEFMMDYLSGELPREAVRRFEAHLGACPNCVRYLAAYKATVELGRRAFEDDEQPATSAGVPEELIQAIVDSRPRG